VSRVVCGATSDSFLTFANDDGDLAHLSVDDGDGVDDDIATRFVKSVYKMWLFGALSGDDGIKNYLSISLRAIVPNFLVNTCSSPFGNLISSSGFLVKELEKHTKNQ
jgi:hypothetical protein